MGRLSGWKKGLLLWIFKTCRIFRPEEGDMADDADKFDFFNPNKEVQHAKR